MARLTDDELRDVLAQATEIERTMITKIGCCVLVAGLWACGTPAVERTTHQRADGAATTQTPNTEAAPPLGTSAAPTNHAPASGSGSEYVIHNFCPYGFRYGNTPMIRGGTLRALPSLLADSLGRVADGGNVRVDSAILILHPPGIGVLVAVLQLPSGPSVGDTVEILHYTGEENPSRVRWRGQEFELLGLLQVIREPTQSWWVHMSDSATQVAGWMRSGGVQTHIGRTGPPGNCR